MGEVVEVSVDVPGVHNDYTVFINVDDLDDCNVLLNVVGGHNHCNVFLHANFLNNDHKAFYGSNFLSNLMMILIHDDNFIFNVNVNDYDHTIYDDDQLCHLYYDSIFHPSHFHDEYHSHDNVHDYIYVIFLVMVLQ